MLGVAAPGRLSARPHRWDGGEQERDHVTFSVARMNGIQLSIALALATTMISGCGLAMSGQKKPELGPEAAEEKARYERDVQDIEAEKRATEWKEQCASKDERRCGLVFDEVNDAAFAKNFIAKVCEEDPQRLEGASKACRARFRKMFLARLAERYVEVTPKALKTRCDAHPEKCKSPRKVERWMLKEHNAVVYERHRVRSQTARDRHNDTMRGSIAKAEVEQERERREAVRTLDQALDALLGTEEPPLPDETCTTEKVADGVEETNCYKRRD